ncbi:MAG: signal peptidase I [Defluviitaleaceae bacterium]|nr:signal peptidase I [Defluviitaleaceae bacterium]
MNREFRKEIFLEVYGWIRLIFFTIAFALFFNFFIIVNAVIPSGSMEQTIMTGDRIIAFRLSYTFAEPQRHDIVILPDPDDLRGELYIKRIVGMPGETLFIADGQVYIVPEGMYVAEPLYEHFLNPNDPPRCNFGPITIPHEYFFVMGDNRNNSMDSRHWNNQFVYTNNILGRAIFRYHPGFTILQ